MSIILASPPAVIDEDLCRKCIGSLKTGAAGKEYEAKKDSIAFRDVQLLRLSYQNILKMDNLVGFDKLIKLQLDNNIIEKIENLSHLTSLTQLDLSFNNISDIAGLDSLTSLTSLSLFSNRITQLGGMDTLSKCFPSATTSSRSWITSCTCAPLRSFKPSILWGTPFARRRSIGGTCWPI